MAISSRGSRSSWHAWLSWKTWVSFVTFESHVKKYLARFSLSSRLAYEPRCTLRTRQSFKTIPARKTAVTFGPWLSGETNLSWGPLWSRRASESFCVTSKAAFSFLTFLSNFACQTGLSWYPGRTLVPRRSRLTLHNAICVAWLSRGPRRARRPWSSISSTRSW